MKTCFKIFAVAFLFIIHVECGFAQTVLTNSDSIPAYVMHQALLTYQRFAAWKGKSEVLLFPIISDVHSSGNDKYKKIGYGVATDSLFHYDFMVNLGDIGLNAHDGTSLSRILSNELVEHTQQEMNKYAGVFLYTPGNHDFDGGEGSHFSSELLSAFFQQPSLNYAQGCLHLTEGKCYGYYDVPAKRCRIIFLNSQATETLGDKYYYYGKEQLDWLVSLMNKTPSRWNIILLSHYMPHEIGRWAMLVEGMTDSTHAILTLLKDFVARSSGGEEGITWDFTQSKARLVGFFAGDSHWSSYINDCGVNYYISQSYGKTGKEMFNAYTHYYKAEMCCEMMMDVVAVRLKDNQVKIFRMSGGNSMDYDVEFSFAREGEKYGQK